MAPLRAIIFDQLERLQTEAQNELSGMARAAAMISSTRRSSQRLRRRTTTSLGPYRAFGPEALTNHWDGPTGFIHTVVYERYLKSHPALEQCEFYLCGPPLMMQAALSVLEECGVDEDSIFFDDFGSSQHATD